MIFLVPRIYRIVRIGLPVRQLSRAALHGLYTEAALRAYTESSGFTEEHGRFLLEALRSEEDREWLPVWQRVDARCW